MPIVAHHYQFVVGVDTHAKNHAIAILSASTGELVDAKQFPTTPAGLARAIALVGRRTSGPGQTLWVIEGSATFGARLAHDATEGGYPVVEAARMNAKAHRGVGKSDPLDAQRIAAAVLPLELDQLRRLRQDHGPRAAVRVALAARDLMTNERTSAINALTGLLRAYNLGMDVRKPLSRPQILEASHWRNRSVEISLATARAEAIRLAKRIIALEEELADNHKTLTELLEQSPARELLREPGIGPITAATAFTAWSHSGRLRDEATFASLAGVNPIPASSGNTIRYRLNRGGDRRLNQALHMAVVVRMRWDEKTKEYVKRRTEEGRTKKEIRRCLKRYLARKIYRILTSAAASDTAEPLPNAA